MCDICLVVLGYALGCGVLLQIVKVEALDPGHAHELVHLVEAEEYALVHRATVEELAFQCECRLRGVPRGGHHVAFALHQSPGAVVHVRVLAASSVVAVNAVIVSGGKHLVDVSLHPVGQLEPPDRGVVDDDVRPFEVLHFRHRVEGVVDVGHPVGKAFLFHHFDRPSGQSIVEHPSRMGKGLSAVDYKYVHTFILLDCRCKDNAYLCHIKIV